MNSDELIKEWDKQVHEHNLRLKGWTKNPQTGNWKKPQSHAADSWNALTNGRPNELR